MLAYTNKARESHINNITRLIEVLGQTTSKELSYGDYREIVNYLSAIRDMYNNELTIANCCSPSL